MKNYLPYISNSNLIAETKKVIDVLNLATSQAPKKLFKNAIDPFSAFFQSSVQNFSLDEWFELEKSRQIQKTLQNAVGTFHQNILGSIQDWESLPTGNVFDLRNNKKKIIAELKNKFNTTKGNHRTAIYDDLSTALKKGEYTNFTAYYIEIIPKNKAKYNQPFTPSDNNTHKRRRERKDIRLVSGQLFYDYASGCKDALKMLYGVLPEVISNITGGKLEKGDEEGFKDLFNKSY